MHLVAKHTVGFWFTSALLVCWCDSWKSPSQSSFPEGFHNNLYVLTIVFFPHFVKEKKKKVLFLNMTCNRSVEVFQPNRRYGQGACLLFIIKNKCGVLTKQIEYGCFLWEKRKSKNVYCTETPETWHVNSFIEYCFLLIVFFHRLLDFCLLYR